MTWTGMSAEEYYSGHEFDYSTYPARCIHQDHAGDPDGDCWKANVKSALGLANFVRKPVSEVKHTKVSLENIKEVAAATGLGEEVLMDAVVRAGAVDGQAYVRTTR